MALGLRKDRGWGSGAVELPFSAKPAVAGPGAAAEPRGRPGSAGAAAPSPALPAALAGEQELGAAPRGRARQEGSEAAGGWGIRIQKQNRQFPSRRDGAQ